MLGGEDVGAHEHFNTAVFRIAAGLGARLTDSTVALPLLLDAAERTVRFAEERDRTIGGRIQYRILRPGQPTEQGFR